MWYGNISNALMKLGDSACKTDRVEKINNQLEAIKKENILKILKEKRDAKEYDKSGLDKPKDDDIHSYRASRGRVNLNKRINEEENDYGFKEM